MSTITNDRQISHNSNIIKQNLFLIIHPCILLIHFAKFFFISSDFTFDDTYYDDIDYVQYESSKIHQDTITVSIPRISYVPIISDNPTILTFKLCMILEMVLDIKFSDKDPKNQTSKEK